MIAKGSLAEMLAVSNCGPLMSTGPEVFLQCDYISGSGQQRTTALQQLPSLFDPIRDDDVGAGRLGVVLDAFLQRLATVRPRTHAV